MTCMIASPRCAPGSLQGCPHVYADRDSHRQVSSACRIARAFCLPRSESVQPCLCEGANTASAVDPVSEATARRPQTECRSPVDLSWSRVDRRGVIFTACAANHFRSVATALDPSCGSLDQVSDFGAAPRRTRRRMRPRRESHRILSMFLAVNGPCPRWTSCDLVRAATG